jgi:hypothetical protein
MYFPKGRHTDSITYVRNTSPDSGWRVVVWRLTDNGRGNIRAGVSGAPSSISVMSSDLGNGCWVYGGHQSVAARIAATAPPGSRLCKRLRAIPYSVCLRTIFGQMECLRQMKRGLELRTGTVACSSVSSKPILKSSDRIDKRRFTAMTVNRSVCESNPR